MSDMIFPVIVGVLFVLLGRWMYSNPEKVYPSWVSSNPGCSFLPKFIRAFATFVIFVGSYAAVAGIAGHILPGLVVWVISLLAGIVAAFLLRPKLNRPIAA